MNQKEIAKSLKQMHESHLKLVQQVVDGFVARQMTRIAKREKKAVEVVSGNGTWAFKIAGSDVINLDDFFYPNEATYVLIDDDVQVSEETKKDLLELHLFLMDQVQLMNVYPSAFNA